MANGRGHVLVALCPAGAFPGAHCLFHGSAPARVGSVDVRVDGVPPGRYAAEAFHDDNDSKMLERNFLGLPRKGIGFSRNAPMRFGPPRFDDAAFDVGSAPAGASLTLRHF